MTWAGAAGREGGTGSHHSLYSDKYSINSMNQKLSVLAIVTAYHPFTVYLMLHVCTESLFYTIPVLREINIYLQQILQRQMYLLQTFQIHTNNQILCCLYNTFFRLHVIYLILSKDLLQALKTDTSLTG